MSHRSNAQRARVRQFFWSLLGVLVVSYFLYHTVQGERGWFAMVRMKNEVQTAERTLGQLVGEREELERRTQLLRSDSMDPDLLEEKSRELLNYSKPDEIVVLTPNEAKAQAAKPAPEPQQPAAAPDVPEGE